MEELKPCPLCKSDAFTNEGDLGRWYVSCFNCYLVLGEAFEENGSVGMFETEEEAIQAWNTRKGG
jgi:hypothetical protein